jgi:hypothetical protein
MNFITLAIGVASLALSGCASIVSGANQSVSVVAKSDGGDVVGAKCSLTNDKGQSFATTPGSVTVHRSYGAMVVDCKTDTSAGSAQVKSSTKGMAFGNILFGGVIGAGVDVATGAAYDHPELITVALMTGMVAPMPQAMPSPLPNGGAVPLVASAAVPPAVPAVPAVPVAPVAIVAPAAPAAPPALAAPPPPARPIKFATAPVPEAPTMIPVVAAPADVRPPLPVRVSEVAPRAPVKGGQDAYEARKAAVAMQCSDPAAPVLTAKNPGSELYSVACANGTTIAVQCDFGKCRALR